MGPADQPTNTPAPTLQTTSGAAQPSVAIVGAGMAGASCARMLLRAGCRVSVLEKSRGAGGRMATRRATWTNAQGQEGTGRFDHGAPSFAADHAEFQQAITESVRSGSLAWWEGGEGWVACPEQPAWAKQWLEGVDLHVLHTVTRLHRLEHRWFLECAESASLRLGPFDAVVLAVPAIQAAPLVDPFHSAWAVQARAVVHQPTWTLMASRTGREAGHDDQRSQAPHTPCDNTLPAVPSVIRPTAGPLALVIRNDTKPGRRPSEPGHEQWVAHATDEWTLAHLEDPAERVEAALRAALETVIDAAITPHTRHSHKTQSWDHTVVHRWRYATVKPCTPAIGKVDTDDWASRPCLWDPSLGLGLAGDAFAGPRRTETGVQRAWLSGAALARTILGREPRV